MALSQQMGALVCLSCERIHWVAHWMPSAPDLGWNCLYPLQTQAISDISSRFHGTLPEHLATNLLHQ